MVIGAAPPNLSLICSGLWLLLTIHIPPFLGPYSNIALGPVLGGQVILTMNVEWDVEFDKPKGRGRVIFVPPSKNNRRISPK